MPQGGIELLHGKGDQYFLTKEYQEKREKALRDRTKYVDATLDDLDLLDDTTLGGGKTDNSNYMIKQFPFPLDSSIKSKKTLDIRIADPRISD